MLSSKYGFGQSMDCLGQSMDPYFERAIHGLSMAQNDTQRGIGAGQASLGSSPPPTRRDQVCPPAGNECPFLMGHDADVF